MQFITHTLILGTVALLVACGGSKEETTNIPAPTETAPATAPKSLSVVDPDHDQGNQPAVSESISIAGITLHINAQGKLVPNAKYRIEMALVSGEQSATVRIWIGDESGVGSMKMKAGGHGDHYHVPDIAVPKEVNSKTALWIEVQSASGEKELGKIALQ